MVSWGVVFGLCKDGYFPVKVWVSDSLPPTTPREFIFPPEPVPGASVAYFLEVTYPTVPLPRGSGEEKGANY